jgi:O-acetyl-ADP-ribose deacetylase (regulator of RNase III)
MITLTHGNMFDVDVEVLVNTVNTVGVMGRGVALQFKSLFPANYSEYAKVCRQGMLHPGDVLVHRVPKPGLPRFIFNVATKKHWRGASRIEYVAKGLIGIISNLRETGARSIALPPLGCGLGGLEWVEVLPLIERAFSEVPEVQALVYEPADGQNLRNSKRKPPRPNLTKNRAALLALMQRYLDTGYDYALTLLEVQKLAYLMQEAGHALKLNFRAHFYGPYADNLQNVLNTINGHFIEGVADGSNSPSREVTLLPDAVKEASELLASDPSAQARLERVASLINGFDTPFGMELLTTVHWVAMHGPTPAQSPAAAYAAVRAWNERKATIVKLGHVEAAWLRLSEQGWLRRAPSEPN